MKRYALTIPRKGRHNVKTGPIPVSTSSKDTCPKNCPLKDTECYARFGPLAIHWNKVTNGERGTNWNEFVKQIKSLSDNALWRHNQAGDLPSNDGETINIAMLAKLVSANTGKRGFTYTHYDVENNKVNRQAVKVANDNGFTINLSANDAKHADKLIPYGPTVCVVSENAKDVSYTPKGNKIVVCPAQTRENVTCSTCGICANAKRNYIVGFKVHGHGQRYFYERTGENKA